MPRACDINMSRDKQCRRQTAVLPVRPSSTQLQISSACTTPSWDPSASTGRSTESRRRPLGVHRAPVAAANDLVVLRDYAATE
jgi:hypothetical protein